MFWDGDYLLAFTWGLRENATHFAHLRAVSEALAEWDDRSHEMEHEELGRPTELAAS